MKFNFSILIFSFLFFACSSESSTVSKIDSSSESTALDSVFGKAITLYVEGNDGGSNTISVGKSIYYHFVDSQTILGDGEVTLPTSAWEYSKTSNTQARVYLVYGGNGTETYLLTATSETSGSFRGTGESSDGYVGEFWGSYTISNASSGANAGSGGTGVSDGLTNSGGDIATKKFGICIWTSNNSTGGNIDIYIDGVYYGFLDSYFSVLPNYGQSGTLTVSLTEGSHIIQAVSANGSEWNGSVQISGEILYELK